MMSYKIWIWWLIPKLAVFLWLLSFLCFGSKDWNELNVETLYCTGESDDLFSEICETNNKHPSHLWINSQTLHSVVHKGKWSHACRLTFSLFLWKVGLSSTVSICIVTLSHLFLSSYLCDMHFYSKHTHFTKTQVKVQGPKNTCRVLHKIGLYIKSRTVHNLESLSICTF